MKVLFVHQNFPGQFLHLLRHLIAEGGHQIVFITRNNDNRLAGLRKLVYTPAPPSRRTHPDAMEFDAAMRRAEAVAAAATALRAEGFTPDMILGHEGWGEMLNLADIWPHVPRLGYREYFYRLEGLDVGFDPEFPVDPALHARIRAKNAVNLLALHAGGRGVTPTAWQRATYPAWAQPDIALVADGVDLATCRPAPRVAASTLLFGATAVPPGAPLITYVARDLEPYRGFHILMRALPAILAARPDAHAVLIGGDGVTYGTPTPGETWRARMLREIAGRADLARIHFPGRVPYAEYLAVLQRSDVHVYLSYPFITSWSLREAMACGCAIVASDIPSVTEFVTDGVNGVTTPFLDPERLAKRVLDLLEDAQLRQTIRQGARALAESHLRLSDHVDGYVRLIKEGQGSALDPQKAVGPLNPLG